MPTSSRFFARPAAYTQEKPVCRNGRRCGRVTMAKVIRRVAARVETLPQCNLAHHPGGSSSGMCAFGIGTETDSSIIFLADRNALVGVKPTAGLTSTLGV